MHERGPLREELQLALSAELASPRSGELLRAGISPAKGPAISRSLAPGPCLPLEETTCSGAESCEGQSV